MVLRSVSTFRPQMALIAVSAVFALAACASAPEPTQDAALPAPVPDPRLAQADKLLRAGSDSDAITLLTEIIATRGLAPTDYAAAREMRGALYLQSADCRLGEAETDLRAALRDDALPPDRAQALRLTLADIDARGAASCSGNGTAPLEPVKPAYPRECYARLAGYGEITLAFDIDPSGTPNNLRVRDRTDSCMVGPSMMALSQMQFRPQLINGQPVARDNVEVTFRAGEPGPASR